MELFCDGTPLIKHIINIYDSLPGILLKKD